uniref:V-type proton ATPase subunit G n=1 Tax=Sus scrofa TaxID=9823 RepID=A0A4X1UYH5_PIG
GALALAQTWGGGSVERRGPVSRFRPLLDTSELLPPWLVSRRASSSCSRLRSEPRRRCPRPASALGSHGSCSTEVEKDTQEKMTILQTYFRQNRDEVLDNLLAFVCDIRPEIHENYRING